MVIFYDNVIKIFYFKIKKISYIVKVLESDYLLYLYWGKKINSNNLDYFLEKNLWGSFFFNMDSIGNF